jgi:hypothetical protein
MGLESISFLFGALLLLAAILGAGLEVAEIKVPSASPPARIGAAIAGVLFICLRLFIAGNLSSPIASPGEAPPSTPGGRPVASG